MSFLNILSNCGFVVELNRRSIVSWISIRGIRCKELLLHKIDNDLLKDIISLQTSDMVKVHISETQDFPGCIDIISALLNNCLKLTSIEIWRANISDSLILKLDSIILASLTHIDIQHSAILSGESIVHLANYCKLLQYLLLEADCAMYENKILNICKKNSNLVTFHITKKFQLIDNIIFELSDNFYLELISHCPNLANVHIYSSRLASSSIILTLISELKNLTMLDLVEQRPMPHFQYKKATIGGIEINISNINAVDSSAYYAPILRELGDKITHISFNFTRLTLRLLKDIFTFCRFNLKYFRIFKCQTDYSVLDLRAVIEGCPKLVSFVLSDSGMSSADVTFLLSVSNSITHLELWDIRDMTSAWALSFVDSNTRLMECTISSDFINDIDQRVIQQYMQKRRDLFV
jgi:ABC-type transporter Mla MlaB component